MQFSQTAWPVSKKESSRLTHPHVRIPHNSSAAKIRQGDDRWLEWPELTGRF